MCLEYCKFGTMHFVCVYNYVYFVLQVLCDTMDYGNIISLYISKLVYYLTISLLHSTFLSSIYSPLLHALNFHLFSLSHHLTLCFSFPNSHPVSLLLHSSLTFTRNETNLTSLLTCVGILSTCLFNYAVKRLFIFSNL